MFLPCAPLGMPRRPPAFQALRAIVLGLLLPLSLAVPAPAGAQSPGPGLLHFLERLTPGEVVPGADRFGEPEGDPPIVPAYDGERLLGYVFLNSDLVSTIGYSGRPIHIVLGIDPDGTIVGARLVMHTEPIVVIGIPESRVIDYMEGFVGFNPLRALAAGEGPPDVDIVSGATVTVLVMGETMMRSAARVARRLGLAGAEALPAGPQRFLDPEAGEVTDFETLLGEGAVRRLVLTVGDVNEAFERAGDERAIARPEPGAPDETFIELYVALVSHPAIGRSLLGEAEHANALRMMEPDRHAIVIAGDGRYSFKGSGYVRGGIFDRIELVQGIETVRFRDRDHRRIGDLAADGAPRLREVGVFVVPEGSDFDPAEPWRLQLLVQRATRPPYRAFLRF
jgi:NosR/NirI family transcriptional regulator, nitrous oxide reductase regulator